MLCNNDSDIDELCSCDRSDESLSAFVSDRQCQRHVHFPNITVFAISLIKCNRCQARKTFSVDVSLLSYAFLVRLINRVFHLHSNFTLNAKHHSTIADDFDLDDVTHLENPAATHLEFLVQHYDIDDWCVIDDVQDENFQVIETSHDAIVVTVASVWTRPETLLQKATGWLHGSVHSMLHRCITKRDFRQMLDASTGRLSDERVFRQRVFDHGCESSIRRTVWCYLFRIFDPSMTHADKVEYGIKAKERYDAMKHAWQNRSESEIHVLENLIDKDVTRTDSSVKFFENKHNLSREKLLHILMTYCVYHPEPGYVQGMSDMAAPILYVIRDEALAYACFCALMRHMSPLFHSNGIAMHRRLDRLRQTIRAIDPDLWQQIELCDIGNLMFAYRWLLLDCKREFPFKDMFRVLETLWASLAIDRFDTNACSEIDDLCPASILSHRHSSMVSSITNTILSSRSSSPVPDDLLSDQSSLDGGDSGYRDEHVSPMCDLHVQSDPLAAGTSSCLPLEQWLKNFSSIDDEDLRSDMFTIFLCMGLLEQHRSSIMHVPTLNADHDDQIGCYFARLVRQNDAKQALQLARHYHRQYVSFQLRLKHLLFA